MTWLKILACFPTEKCSICKMSHFPWKNAVSAVHISLVADLVAKTPILATANMQFGQEMALVMRSTDSIPIVSTSFCFLPLKMYTGITKILEFEYKTDVI